MKIQIVSDLHLEWGAEIKSNIIPVGDVLVVAGDLDTGVKETCRSLLELSNFVCVPIIYVLGNHEFYGGEYAFIRKEFEKRKSLLEKNEIYVLDQGTVIINNVLFIGATGWTDGSYMEYKPYLNLSYPDAKKIRGFKEAGGQNWGKEDIKYIERELKRNDYGLDSPRKKTVVITHHAPCELSLSERYRGESFNTFFINDWSHIIDMYHPELWIHGHMHTSFDYTVYDTRVICNPSGYFRLDPNTEYQLDLFIEI